MRTTLLLALAACALAASDEHEKRQDSVSELLQLASIAGITALPTSPAFLLSIAPIANQLASELPTAPVLSVLETAAPSGFLSQILHDPSFASSFESAFAAGTPPGWFVSLPTSVKSYLHTYSDYGAVATDAGEIAQLESNATAAPSGTTASTTSTTQSGGKMSLTTMVTTSGTGALGTDTASASSTPSGGREPSTTSSVAGAAETAGLGLGVVGVVGLLGLAAVL
ncbi:hypothetical protein MMC13_004641 [Lambiella insularis]|nr:hypothetical protein [Lambiella insularis]